MMTLKPAQAFEQIAHAMKNQSRLVVTERWQAQEVNATMCEFLHYQFRMALTAGTDIDEWQKLIEANYPWAEDHFKERVCGWPLNPGIEWAHWPWANKADKSRSKGGMFNHNYMERFWPKFADAYHPTTTPQEFEEWMTNVGQEPMMGLRHEYGDLGEMIQMLAEEPSTRQAYLPIWFPEDTSYANKGRKPCTLGYHFILRNGRLDITYHIRSCDFYRHFDDDVYMAVRLAIHVLQSCRMVNPNVWNHVQLGELVMNITSLHMFLSDYQLMFKQQHPDH